MSASPIPPLTAAPRSVRGTTPTDAVHAGEISPKPFHSLIDPVFQTSTFVFDSMADAVEYQTARLFGPVEGRFDYGRYGNPTSAAAETRLASLEGAESAILVSSGMAALTFTFLHLLPAGSHIVITDDSYRRTRQFCEGILKNHGVEHTIVPLGDFAALEAAIRPETKVIFSEAPSNPYLRILDLERFAETGRRRGLVTVVDSTLATPVNQRPLEWGIDLVIHSATKYLGGHNDLLAGVIAGRGELIQPLRETIGVLGGINDPQTAFLLLRGIKTLALRVQHQNRSAQRIAEYLSAHPAVEQVWYPGLPGHPGHDLAKRQMTGYGGLLSLAIRGGQEQAFAFIDALKIPAIAPSLGGTESLVLHMGVFAYFECEPEERLALGIPDNLVRLSIGIEDPDDLIADLEQALRSPGLIRG